MSDERSSLEEHLITAMLMGTRVLPALGGLAFGGPVGGAAGGMAGETLAQGIERYLGRREEFNPASIGINTVLGGVPLGRVAQAGRWARMGREAAKGAGMGVAADVPLQLAETGAWDPRQTLISAGMGAGLGSLGGIARPKARLRAEPAPVDLDFVPSTAPSITQAQAAKGETGQLLLPGANRLWEKVAVLASGSPGSQAWERLGGVTHGGPRALRGRGERASSALLLEDMLQQIAERKGAPNTQFLKQLGQIDKDTRIRATKLLEKLQAGNEKALTFFGKEAGKKLSRSEQGIIKRQIAALTKVKSGLIDPMGPSGKFPGFKNINLPGTRHFNSKAITKLRYRANSDGTQVPNFPTQSELNGLWARGKPWAAFYSTIPEQIEGVVPPQHQIAFLSDNAGYSPQASPREALVHSVFGASRREAGLHTRGTGVETAWVNRRAIESGIVDPMTGGFSKRGHGQGLDDVGEGGWVEIGQDGLKIRNYRENLLERYDTGDGPIVRMTPNLVKKRMEKGEDMVAWVKHIQDEAVTIDTWMASLYGIDASRLQNTQWGRDMYVAMANDIRRKARKAGKTPSEYQAGIWAGVRQNMMEGGETIGGSLRVDYGQRSLLPKLTIAPGAAGKEITTPIRELVDAIGETELGAGGQGVLPLEIPTGVRYMLPDEEQINVGDVTAAGRTPREKGGGLRPGISEVWAKITAPQVLNTLRMQRSRKDTVGLSKSMRTGEDVADAPVMFVALKNRDQRTGKLAHYSERQWEGLPNLKDLLSFLSDQSHRLAGKEGDTVMGVFFEQGRHAVTDRTHPLFRWTTSKHGGRTTADVSKMIPEKPVTTAKEAARHGSGRPPEYELHGFRTGMDTARLNEQFSVWHNEYYQLVQVEDLAVTVNPKNPNRLVVKKNLGTPRFADESRPESTKYGFTKQQSGDFVGWTTDEGLSFARNQPPNTQRVRGELIYDLFGSPTPVDDITSQQLSFLKRNEHLGAGADSVGGDFRGLLQGTDTSRTAIEKQLKEIGYQGYYTDASKTEIVWFGDAVEGWNYPWKPKGY